jgi:hypothetical protein
MVPPYSPILARAVVRNIVIPYFAIYLYLPNGTSLPIYLVIYALAPFLVYTAHVFVRTQYHRYRAWRLSAIMVPFVDPAFKPKGSPWYKRIGNLDLMMAWDKEGQQGYIGDGMVRYALEGAGGTVNTRILGEDSVSGVSTRKRPDFDADKYWYILRRISSLPATHDIFTRSSPAPSVRFPRGTSSKSERKICLGLEGFLSAMEPIGNLYVLAASVANRLISPGFTFIATTHLASNLYTPILLSQEPCSFRSRDVYGASHQESPGYTLSN